MSQRARLVTAAVLAAVLTLTASGIAIATSGLLISASIIATGTATEKVMTRGSGPYDVVVQHVTIYPSGHTGWHTHPGMAIAVVRKGTLTIYHGDDKDCTPHRYHAGMVYIDPGYGQVHIGRNEGLFLGFDDVEIEVTYLDVPVGGSFRIDAPAPGNCAF